MRSLIPGNLGVFPDLNYVVILVQMERLELSSPQGRRLLRPMRIPIPPHLDIVVVPMGLEPMFLA